MKHFKNKEDKVTKPVNFKKNLNHKKSEKGEDEEKTYMNNENVSYWHITIMCVFWRHCSHPGHE